MKEVIDFLNRLSENNNKPWFDAHKEEYKRARACFENFVTELIKEIESFDKSIYGLSVSDCTYRIYRDIRFSRDKTPYKTHMGAYICPKGKKSGLAGYYFHIESESRTYLPSHLLATGAVCLPKESIRSIREDIYSLYDEFEQCVHEAEGFSLDTESSMKVVPKDFPKGTKADNALKLRDFILSKHIDDSYILSSDLLDRLVRDFKKTKNFNDFINRAIKAEM